MKDDRLYLIHLTECIERIERYTAPGHAAFLADTMIQDAVLRNLHTLSESTQRLSDALKARHPEVDWPSIAAFRDELTMIRRYIDQGGSVFLTGLGWVWTQYGHRPIEEYPLNIIAKEYGIWFVEDYVWNVVKDASPIFYAPFMNREHPITQGVSQIASPESVPGSLIVEPPAVPIIWGDNGTEGWWNNKNPVILAAASVGEGRIVCLQQGGYVLAELEEYDDFVLLENILTWLVSK